MLSNRGSKCYIEKQDEKTMLIYTIPGLGFDQRIFNRISIPGHHLHHLDWVDPLREESLDDYAWRMSDRISNKKEPIAIIGHSFGGIVAQEIAQQRKISKVVLLSSIRSQKENPLHFRMMHPLFLDRLISKSFILRSFPLWGKRLGYESAEDQRLFLDMVGSHSNQYLRWAMKELSRWQGARFSDTATLQIHGQNDKTFPIRRIPNADYKIEQAGHFMVYQKPEVINPILALIFNQE